jgi:protein SCO1/2
MANPLSLLFLAACNFSAGETYEVVGTVLEVEDASILVDHEEIPGFMDAMIMPFSADPNLLRGLARGDRIKARLLVANANSQLIGIEVTGEVDLPAPEAAPLGVEALEIGGLLAAMDLPTSNGPLRIGAGQGQTTVLSFLFTSCPLPEYCPLLATKLVQLQERIRGEARIVIVTLDPETDTFEVLAGYGAAMGADPAIWHYVSADLDTLTPLFDAVEMTLAERNGMLLHSLKLLVLAPDGTLRFLAKDNGWDLDAVADAVAGDTTSAP